jgi:hypothetical protein
MSRDITFVRLLVGWWGVLKTPPTSRNAALLREYPQVKRGSTHSRSEALSGLLGRAARRPGYEADERGPEKVTYTAGGGRGGS